MCVCVCVCVVGVGSGSWEGDSFLSTVVSRIKRMIFIILIPFVPDSGQVFGCDFTLSLQ